MDIAWTKTGGIGKIRLLQLFSVYLKYKFRLKIETQWRAFLNYMCIFFAGLYNQGLLEWWQHWNNLQTLQQVLWPSGEQECLCFFISLHAVSAHSCCDWGAVTGSKCLPSRKRAQWLLSVLVYLALFGLIHIMWVIALFQKKIVNVHVDLNKTSDKCDDCSIDYRNAWVIFEHNVAGLCWTRQEFH